MHASVHQYARLYIAQAFMCVCVCVCVSYVSQYSSQHSPGHESLVVRIANFEIRNAGQAFRLGRYAIHWHMVGNLRESFQRNVSVHHSWNRSVAQSHPLILKLVCILLNPMQKLKVAAKFIANVNLRTKLYIFVPSRFEIAYTRTRASVQRRGNPRRKLPASGEQYGVSRHGPYIFH
jgi:hypothetical protein